MTAFLRIDQVGLPPGTPGRSRTDGLANGANITLTDTSPGSGTTEFRLLWTPPVDAVAVASLAASVDPKVWTFQPTAGKYGTYLVELVRRADPSLLTVTRERRVIVMRTPNLGLVIPALGELGYPTASLADAGGAELVDNNATDFGNPAMNAVPYAAWWRAIHELIMTVDAAGSGGGGTEIPDGSIVGQPTVWDGAAWVPLEPGQQLVIDRLASPTGMLVEPQGEYRVTAPAIVLDTSPYGGALTLAGNEIGFFDKAPVARPTLTAGEGTAVEQVIAALVTLGLIVDDR